jgi:transcriptional regulator with XRE-family HTH domain
MSLGAISLRTFLTKRSILLPNRPAKVSADDDWYSSSDTQKLAEELEVEHALVVGWASGMHVPTKDEAERLYKIGGPLPESWPAIPEKPEKRIAHAQTRPHLETRCQCASHAVSYAAPDYDDLPMETRRFLLRRIATGSSTQWACEERRVTAGPVELADLQVVLSDQPGDIPFLEWETEAWNRIKYEEDTPIVFIDSVPGDAPSMPVYTSTYTYEKLAQWLKTTERSASFLAARLGVTAETVQWWIGNRSKPSLEHALQIMEMGGPSYLHWLEFDAASLNRHRKPPAADWGAPVIEHLKLSPRFRKAPKGKYRPSRGLYQMRLHMAAKRLTLAQYAISISATRAQAYSWMAGTATPSLPVAWRIYQEGGPPVRSWKIDHTMAQSPDGSTVVSEAELQRAVELKAVNDAAADLERYKEQARWAVSRPVLPATAPKSTVAIEQTYEWTSVYHARVAAAEALLRARPGGLEAWKAKWAREFVDGRWLAPWEVD